MFIGPPVHHLAPDVALTARFGVKRASTLFSRSTRNFTLHELHSCPGASRRIESCSPFDPRQEGQMTCHLRSRTPTLVA